LSDFSLGRAESNGLQVLASGAKGRWLESTRATHFNSSFNPESPFGPSGPGYLILIASAGASWWASRYRIAAVACAALLAFQVVSYLRRYRNEIAYANEAWGGPENLHRYLGDSNVDWGQSLYMVRDYLKQRDIHDCWIAWFGMRKPQLTGVPCRALAGPMFPEAWDWELPPVLPDCFEGTVLVSSTLTDLDLFPYGSFLRRAPDDVIGGGVYVFHGRFDLPEIAAERRAARGWWFLNHGQPQKCRR